MIAFWIISFKNSLTIKEESLEKTQKTFIQQKHVLVFNQRVSTKLWVSVTMRKFVLSDKKPLNVT